MFLNYYFQKCMISTIFNPSNPLLFPLLFPLGHVTIWIIRSLISLYSPQSNQYVLVIIVLDQCKHSKSMDWIDWKVWKLRMILFSNLTNSIGERFLIMQQQRQLPYRNHSTYWIVNHWSTFKLVNTAFVILVETLNWRIYRNCNPFKLEKSKKSQPISIVVP